MSFYCYLLESEISNPTYVGFTVNPKRRIRQHNGELAGGAKATTKCRPYRMICHISGFKTKRHALQFEWALKHCAASKMIKITSKSKNKRINNRVAKMFTLLQKDKVVKTAPLNCDQQYTITWLVDRYHELDNMIDNVECVWDLSDTM